MDINVINWGMVSMLAGLGIGYWLRGQTYATLQSDVTAIKNEVEKLKNLFTTPPATSTTTSAVQTTTSVPTVTN